ncbi:porin [Paraburkholderia haematera]|jgi:Outer membrane protein (porin)|uniref:Outer membrane porin protein n=1 Tax=Paraburkholderia haematera TaxID=2793077 RepID=A0ABN7KFU3_9BURK|nr:porin [Paraburkholderia haematera]CAE6691035.1 Outer membrane porin protein [Paraburkholderia haematera]
MKKIMILAAVSATFASAAQAQSSVTLYGLIDAGLTYVSNEANKNSQVSPTGVTNGHSMVGLTGGNLQASRWGLRGAEDLGGGLKAIFTLESGFNVANGKQSVTNTLFNRQAFVGLSDSQYGTFTLGRQYDSVVDYLGPVSAAGSWGGTYLAHRGDNDNLNNTISINNSVKYQSANYAGFSFSGLYGFSNQAGGFANNRAYSVGAGYQNGGLQAGAAYLQIQGVNANANGAVQNLPASATAALPGVQNQRTWGVGASYTFGPAVVGGVFTQTRLQDQIADASVRYNNYEINAHYNLTPALGLGAAYTYTQALRAAPGTTSTNTGAGHWNQFGLQADYALSKRTDLYLEGVLQTGAQNQVGVNVTQVNGTDAPSASKNQYVLTSGIRHRF